jgi:DNA-binding phage protein
MVLMLTNHRAAANGLLRETIQTTGSWMECRAHLLGSAPPDIFVADAAELNDRVIADLRLLLESGSLPRTVVYFRAFDPELLGAVWRRLGQLGVNAAFGEDALNEEIRRSTMEPPLGQYLMRHFNVESTSLSGRLITLLETNKRMRTASTAIVARRLGVGRTTLYASLTRAGLPPVDELQVLFRLVQAVVHIQRGEALESVASRTGYSEARSLRRSLRIRAGARVRELREGTSWRTVVRYCLNRR